MVKLKSSIPFDMVVDVAIEWRARDKQKENQIKSPGSRIFIIWKIVSVELILAFRVNRKNAYF